jgi:hypothetical protein
VKKHFDDGLLGAIYRHIAIRGEADGGCIFGMPSVAVTVPDL